MRVPVNVLRFALPATALAFIVRLAFLWQPARQVELHTQTLLERVSARDWPSVQEMLAPDYTDPWAHDRAALVDDARALFSHFFVLHVVMLEPPAVMAEGGAGEVSARLGIFGSGTGVAQAMIEEAQALRRPFVFRWRKSGAWPWDWQLSSLGQGELEARFPGGAPSW